MRLIYDFLFLVYSLLYFPYLLIKRKGHSGFRMRFGAFPEDLKERLKRKDNIWVHAVSVGEVAVVKRLIENLKKIFPSCQLVVSTVTKTGYEVALKQFPGDIIIFSPLDFSFCVGRYLHFIKPKIYITVETELWPNLFAALKKQKIPVVLVNGRISDVSYSRYRWVKFLLKGILAGVDSFCMQSDKDAQRIKDLGAKQERVTVTGNMKFDDIPGLGEDKRIQSLFDGEAMPLVGGSTHPGEEEILLSVYKILLREFPGLRLALAPRHVERAEDVMRLVESKGFKAVRFSKFNNNRLSREEVLVVDVIGNLKALYVLAKIVFVGKSLTARGGQNIIEPAYFAKPVIVGPYTDNFRDATEVLLKEKAIVQVRGKEELLSEITKLLKDPQERENLGQRAKRAVEGQIGATSRTTAIVVSAMAR